VRAFVRYNAFNSWGWLDAVNDEVLDAVEIFSGDVRDPNGIRETMLGVDVRDRAFIDASHKRSAHL
jgi:dTDP-glucose 4,6-dehydratase